MKQTPEERLLENLTSALNIAAREGIPFNSSLLALISAIISSVINSSDSQEQVKNSFKFVQMCLEVAEENVGTFRDIYDIASLIKRH